MFRHLLFSAVLITAQPAAAADYSAYVADARTNQVMLSDHADDARYPASLTKMMTLYIVFSELRSGNLSLDDRITASREAASQPPTRVGIRAGRSLTVDECIRALAVESANDVAVMFAERLGGSEGRFTGIMNQRARALGMTSTHFENASGLPNPDTHSTAHDMATLAVALWRDFPEYYHYFSTPTYGRARNHNHLLGSVEGVDGLKTGYTRDSGFNLAIMVERDGRRYVIVVMGGEDAQSRDRQIRYLIEELYRPQEENH